MPVVVTAALEEEVAPPTEVSMLERQLLMNGVMKLAFQIKISMMQKYFVDQMQKLVYHVSVQCVGTETIGCQLKRVYLVSPVIAPVCAKVVMVEVLWP